MSDGNLFEQQRANRRRSTILVSVFVLFFAWVGFGGDFAFYLATQEVEPGAYRHTVPWFGLAATVLGLGMAWHARRKGPMDVLWSTGAWEMLEPSKPEEKVLENIIEEMAIASGLPKPRIWLIPDKDPNAFATGIDERSAHVAVTEGLITSLSREELQAVVAHEMAHIRNHDVKLMTLLAALVGVIALISDGAWRFMRHGGGKMGSSGGGRSGGKKGGGALVLIVLIAWLLTLLVAPLVSRLLALGVSRKREFLADATAAQFTRNPGALATALRKIEDAKAPTKAIRRGAAHLCIADPLGRRVTYKQGFVADLFGTHPPIAVRIARLSAMAYQYEKTGVMPEG